LRIILARHGNTFGPGDTPVWVGAKEDLPLVDKGREQSTVIGTYLTREGLDPDQIIAGPLQRTREGAELIAGETGYDAGAIRIDDRLKEIDYGSWGGKSDAEIIDLYGEEVIHDWRERTIVPAGADWSPGPEALKQAALDVLNEIVAQDHETVLLVSSNGTLRYFHAAWYDNLATAPPAKVKTGHICIAEWMSGRFIPEVWNLNPATPLTE